MAKVKYAAAVIPLLNKHFGAVFQPNHTSQTMKSDSNGARTRWTRQTQKQQGLMKAVRMWRNMSVATKTNWNTFAAAYPQASRRNPAIFLTGYQLFLKRNHYCFLNHGIDCDFMEEPTLEELPNPDFSFSIEDSENVLDVTELYISNFGIIPTPGQFVLIRVFPMSQTSGQFFQPFEQIIEVTESYIDGLFVSLAFASDVRNLTFSVYLSKVFHKSIKYVGTKVRYMGCFTPKTFLALTDTPDSYAGEAEKQVVVKADETGLEFIEGGGGGITCEDLPDCPVIIDIEIILELIDAIINYSDYFITNWNLPVGVFRYPCTVSNGIGETTTIVWGDGETTVIPENTIATVINHTYAQSGNYNILMKGFCVRWSAIFYSTDYTYFSHVVQWGNITIDSWQSAFRACVFTQELPSGGMSALSATPGASPFNSMFEDSDIKTLPSDLFKNFAIMTELQNCFYNSQLETIPSGLLDPCILLVNLTRTFRGCKLQNQIPLDLFANQPNTVAMYFYQTFYGNAVYYDAVPELWISHDLAGTKAQCFGADYNASNYAAIPSAWK